MTNAEADALIATLPKPKGLQIAREDDYVRMTGGKTGDHTIAVGPSSAERMLVHWQGYVENNGRTLGTGYTKAAIGKTAAAKPRTKKSKPRKRQRPFKRAGVVGIHSDPPDGYIILKPHSTTQASAKIYTNETQALKAPRALDEKLSTGAASHELSAIRWTRKM